MTTKKSFILMRDLLSTVDLMTDEEAGKILKAIINHVDEKPVQLSRDLIFAFTPIQNQLSRDLEKYDNYVEKQRVNGSKGGRPKKPKSKPKNPSLSKKRVAKPKNLVTDTDTVTVNATDTVNDTGTDNDTVTANDKYQTLVGLDVLTFERYLAYRKEAGIKALTKQGELLAAKKLIKFGKQSEVVDQSISNGWAGLFALKVDNRNQKNDEFNEWIDSYQKTDSDNVIDGECHEVK